MATLPTLPEYLQLEHDVSRILTRQEHHGIQFDFDSAWKLASSLGEELRHVEELLRSRHPYVYGSEFTPKRTNGRTGYVAGATFTRLKELNPSSRDHRRGDPERDWDGSSDDVPPDLDDQEDAWNDTRRRERLDEAEYDC